LWDGFDYDKRVGDFDLLMESLLVYKSIHGDVDVPKKFIIAEKDMRYPERMKGRGSTMIYIFMSIS